MIDDQPKNVTLYLGRAKAKFLSGDVAGAESDIKAAGTLQPNNRSVLTLRERIVEGNVLAEPAVVNPSKANELTNRGHEAMRLGDGEIAYIRYSEAAEAGASRPFSMLNRAMACVLAGDLAGASNILNEFKMRPGTPMEINIIALKAVLTRLTTGGPDQSTIEALQRAVKSKGDFSFQLSPLNILQTGLFR